jgi:hypothetical protein
LVHQVRAEGYVSVIILQKSTTAKKGNGKTDKIILQHKYLKFAKRKGNVSRENRIKMR